MSSINDLGVFKQGIWVTLNGQWLTDIYGSPSHWLSCHFNLFLFLFAPLYAIWPTIEWLTIAQALALTIAAWPIFILASKVHDSERTGIIWAVIYLLNPFLLNAAAWDFHPVTLAVPFIAGALLAVENKSSRLLIICCLCLLLIQEQLGITVAGFGALWWLKNRDWKAGLLLVAVGLLHTVLVLGVFMPALTRTGTHFMLVDPNGEHGRYGWLGSNLSEVFANFIFQPVWVLKTIILKHGALSYFTLLALPLSGLFLAAPLWLIPTIADLAANTLSANGMPRYIISYHSVTLVPVMTVAAIYGARRIAPLLAKIITIPVTHVVLMSTLVSFYAFAPLPLPGALNIWNPVKWAKTPDPALKQVRALTGKFPSLSVQANIGTHFSMHQLVHRYPYKTDKADAIVLWLDSPTDNISPHDRHIIGTLAHHLQMNPAEYLASVECLLRDHDYKVLLWQDPWLVINRGAGDEHTNQSVQRRIEALCTQWGITLREYENARRTCLGK